MRSGSRPLALAFVLLAHLALWWAARWAGVGALPAADLPPPLVVQFVRQPTAVPAAGQPEWRPAWRPAPPPPAARLTAPAIQLRPDAAVAPASVASAPARTPSTAPAAGLDLRLPSAGLRSAGAPGAPSARQQALDDPRANSAPKTVETRIAQALTHQALRVESLGEGRRRVYSGTDCVEVHDAGIARIDPFNQSVSPTPKQVRPCD